MRSVWFPGRVGLAGFTGLRFHGGKGVFIQSAFELIHRACGVWVCRAWVKRGCTVHFMELGVS